MEICRLCMHCDDKSLVSIFSVIDNVNIAKTITFSCSIKLSEDDGLPDKICKPCVRDVQSVNTFVEKVRSTDIYLRSDLAPRDDEKPPIEVIVVKTELSDDDSNGVGVTVDGDDAGHSNVELKSESDSDEDALSIVKARIKKSLKKSDTKSKKQRKRKRKSKPESDDEPEVLDDNESLDEKEQEVFDIINLPEVNYVCCGCYQYFKTPYELEVHTEVHKKVLVKKTDRVFCQICKQRFNKTGALDEHQRKLNAVKKIYECRICNTRFIGVKRRRRHAYRHPKTIEDKMKQEFGEILCCVTNCNKAYPTEELLVRHSQEAHKIHKRAYESEEVAQKPSECPVCYKRFASVLLLRRHRKRNSRPMSHQCATCGLKFRTKDVLLNHEMNHDNQKPFACDICKKHFTSSSALKAHQKYHLDERPFICATCGAGFYQKAQLITHEYDHGSAPLPFQCEVCNKSFKMKGGLVNHMRLHTGERPFPCRHCSMSFSNNTTRQRHEMNHTGDKPFKCTYCDKKFTIKRLQVEHECKHTGIKPYKCSFCDKTFIRKRFQIDHESSHAGVKPYNCDLCKRGFTHKTGLRRHRMEFHRQEVENESPPGRRGHSTVTEVPVVSNDSSVAVVVPNNNSQGEPNGVSEW